MLDRFTETARDHVEVRRRRVDATEVGVISQRQFGPAAVPGIVEQIVRGAQRVNLERRPVVIPEQRFGARQ